MHGFINISRRIVPMSLAKLKAGQSTGRMRSDAFPGAVGQKLLGSGQMVSPMRKNLFCLPLVGATAADAQTLGGSQRR